MTSSILRSMGLRCGSYTSPHLWSIPRADRAGRQADSRRRLAAGRSLVFRSQARRSCERILPKSFGRFEAITAVALYHYAHRRPDVVVAEAGVGGRYDSTRVIPGSLAALTSLDLEHADVLGSTPELIACEKADLCPEGGTLVAGAMDQDLFERLSAYCSLRGVRVINAPAVCAG